MEPDAFVPVARVVRLHGLKGDIVVRPADGVSFPFAAGQQVWFVPPPLVGPRTAAVSSVRDMERGTVLHLLGVDDADTAGHLVGKNVSVRESTLPAEWGAEEIDLTGLLVVDEQRGEIGFIEEVIETGANDVWVVRGEQFGEVLVPAIDDVILDFDEDNDIIRVKLLPGLIEED